MDSVPALGEPRGRDVGAVDFGEKFGFLKDFCGFWVFFFGISWNLRGILWNWNGDLTGYNQQRMISWGCTGDKITRFPECLYNWGWT